MLTEEQIKNIHNTVDNWIDTLLFYYSEYGGGENTYEVCHTFCVEFTDTCQKICAELKAEELAEEE